MEEKAGGEGRRGRAEEELGQVKTLTQQGRGQQVKGLRETPKA